VTNDRLWFRGRRPFSFGLGKERPDYSAFIGSASRRQIFGDELTPAKYCQKEWPTERGSQVVAEMDRNPGLN
jgi:hypothetical protein